MTIIEEYAAFTTDSAGGNPAGVVLDAGHLDDVAMQVVAADLGHPETAFVTATRERELTVRYFSPGSEVPFCGHATVATAVAHARVHGTGRLTFHTAAGPVEVVTATTAEGFTTATLTSVAPHVGDVDPGDVAEALAALGWAADDLDPGLPPRWARAGAGHLVLGVRTRERLADLDYDVERLERLLTAHDAFTAALVHRRPAPAAELAAAIEPDVVDPEDSVTSAEPDDAQDPGAHRADVVLDVRNAFPSGGVVEDPATGAAAAGIGAYLRSLALVEPPARVVIHQGVDMGRPGLLVVDVPPGADTGIRVTGTAVPLH